MTAKIGCCLHQTYWESNSNISSYSDVYSFMSQLPLERLITSWLSADLVSFHRFSSFRLHREPLTHQTVQLSLHMRTGIPTWCHWCNSLVIFPVFVTGESHNIPAPCIHKQVKFNLPSHWGETLKMKHEQQPYITLHQLLLNQLHVWHRMCKVAVVPCKSWQMTRFIKCMHVQSVIL